MKIKSVCIVGGGSAGWMTAAGLLRLLPDLDITLVESKEYPTIGVGESTVSAINEFLQAIKVDEEDWVSPCGATYKTAIKFTDWTDEGGSFQFPFGRPDTSNTFNGVSDFFVMQKKLKDEVNTNEYAEYYYPSIRWNMENKMFSEGEEPGDYNHKNDTAYHIDATKFGQWLKNEVCISHKNFTHILGTLEPEGNIDKNGGIESIITDSGNIKADLFIDCTGFKSLLLGGMMQEPFYPMENLLNDRAIFCPLEYIDKELELESVTNCTAIENGWCWNTPLWDRIGTGYVYSSKFCTEKQAEKEFRAYLASNKMKVGDSYRAENAKINHLEIKHGKRENAWVKNVVGIGLSSGFIEPLESTGLLFISDAILELVEKLKARNGLINKFDIDNWNYTNKTRFESWREFIANHYAMSSRRDTPYWRYVTEEIEYNSSLVSELFSARYLLRGQSGDITERIQNGLAPMICISSGQGYNIISDIEFSKEIDYIEQSATVLKKIYDEKKTEMDISIHNAPTNYKFLKDKFFKDK
jgi:tryptophan halogenase